ncbi:ABC transporter ATP-binding protein [Kaistia adipata]|uniref:ABC transporter ATP-binding protein n=1 Tax=Kaistia adipata TaxID=166954 RepID=UPI000412CA14|nr:ABC transporter ATP-binding protein [Kaistia adipata]
MSSVPLLRPDAAPLVEARGLSVSYAVPRAAFWQQKPAPFRAVEGIDFSIGHGETLGIVGESGSGKSTIGRALLGRVPLSAGSARFRGEDISGLSGGAMRRTRRHIQAVMQDPYASLNPRMRVTDIIAEPLVVHGIARGAEARARVDELLDLVGLPPDAGQRHPGTFSGGQRQRIGIARALAMEPAFIVADEPVSALDVSVRAQIVNLFRDLQEKLGVSYLFIAHDLAIVRHVSHRIAVVYAGRIVEMSARDDLYTTPIHPYTQALLDAVPVPDPRKRRTGRATVRGELGAIPAAGCRFAPRCPLASEQCRREAPPLLERAPGHRAACWNA